MNFVCCDYKQKLPSNLLENPIYLVYGCHALLSLVYQPTSSTNNDPAPAPIDRAKKPISCAYL